jgi:integrase
MTKKDNNLPPCVFESHGSYFYVKKSKWTPLGKDLQSALLAHAELTAAPVGGMPALIDRVLKNIEPRLRASTVRQYATVARRLKQILAEFSPNQVKPKDVAAIKVALASTPNFCNRCLSVLRVVFQHAVEWQIVESNPCLGIMRHSEHKRSRYLTDAELAAIRDSAGPRLQIIVDVLYFTGQRVSDVLKIRRADLNADGVSFAQGKTGTKLTVAWTPELKAAVERAKTLTGNVVSMTLLRNKRGKAPDYRSVQLQWETACEAAGVKDARMHDIRAKSLTDAKRQGFDATALAGHASARMTERYIRLRESPVVHGPGALRPGR